MQSNNSLQRAPWSPKYGNVSEQLEYAVVMYVCAIVDDFILYNTVAKAHQKGHACTKRTAVTSQVLVHY